MTALLDRSNRGYEVRYHPVTMRSPHSLPSDLRLSNSRAIPLGHRATIETALRHFAQAEGDARQAADQLEKYGAQIRRYQ
jgi:hypothetical protein